MHCWGDRPEFWRALASEPAGQNSGWGSRQSRTKVSAGRGQAAFQAVKRSGAREKREQNTEIRAWQLAGDHLGVFRGGRDPIHRHVCGTSPASHARSVGEFGQPAEARGHWHYENVTGKRPVRRLPDEGRTPSGGCGPGSTPVMAAGHRARSEDCSVIRAANAQA